MSKLIKSILLLSFFVCLTSLAFAGGNGNNGNDDEGNGHEWCPPDDGGQGEEGEGVLVDCSDEATCYLYVNVVCPISVTCDGDQEIILCSDQDLDEAALADFTLVFHVGGAAGMDFDFTVTVPEQAETQTPLAPGETALTTDGISVIFDANGDHPDAVTDLGDVTTPVGGNFVFESVSYPLYYDENDDVLGECIDPDDMATITVYFLSINTEATQQVGLERFPVTVYVEYVI